MTYRHSFKLMLVMGIILLTGCASHQGVLFEPKAKPVSDTAYTLSSVTNRPVMQISSRNTINVREEEERLTKIVERCDDMVNAADPSDRPANNQFWSRVGFGVPGGFAVYGAACLFPAGAYLCPLVIPLGIGYGLLMTSTSIGDRLAD